MGNRAIGTLNQRLGFGMVPDDKRTTYFNEKLMMGWFELLSCPSAMGCTVVRFETGHPNGGEPQYKIKMRLSHSEHVPRYQLHVVANGKTQQWIVGHMEKTETHLRAKPGEFIRVQVWRLVVNSMVMEARRSALQRKSLPWMSAVKERPTPSAVDMMTMGMTIATQAKLDPLPGDSGKFDKDTERWCQTIGVDNRQYKLTVEPPNKRGGSGDKHHRSLKSMNVMRVLFRGRKVCVARKQRFAGALGKVEQPYLGVQIKPGGGADDQDWAEAAAANAANPCPSLLDTKGLILLVMCLAWSEDTMTPEMDMTERFIKAMMTDPGDVGSADDLKLSVNWDTNDVKERLSHIPFAAVHQWQTNGKVDGAEMPTDDDDDDDEEQALSKSQ